MCIAPSKRKAVSGTLGCTPNINGTPIPYVQSMKILGVLFTDDLDWRLQAESACTRMSWKLSVLRRIGGSLNIRSHAHVYKTCIKPHLEYCLPVWACCGSEQTAIDRVLKRAKRIITNQRTDSIVAGDFNSFNLTSFANMKLISVTSQYFYSVNMPDCNNITLLNQVNKSVHTCASQANKAYICKSKKSCDNCFVFYSS